MVAGFYFGYVVICDFDSIMASQNAFFDAGPGWYADAITFAIAAVPLALISVAVMVFRNLKWWFVLVPAAYGTLLTTGYIAIVLGVYLVWYYAVHRRAMITNNSGA